MYNENDIKLTIYRFGECTVIDGIVIKTTSKPIQLVDTYANKSITAMVQC